LSSSTLYLIHTSSYRTSWTLQLSF
jgi:hypothetical protein